MAEQGEDIASTSTPVLWSTLVAGPVAGVCARFFVYPFDTIKARLQAQRSLNGSPLQYRGTSDALYQVLTKDGPQGLYRGFPAVAIGSLPGNALYFGGYEAAKAVVPGGSGMLGEMAVGAVAQLAAGLAFTPVDIVKERMQVQGVQGVSLRYRGSVDALRGLLRERGVAGLLKGYWATNAVWIPWSMLFLALYSESKRAAAAVLQRAQGPPSSVASRQGPEPRLRAGARSEPHSGASAGLHGGGSGSASSELPGAPHDSDPDPAPAPSPEVHSSSRDDSSRRGPAPVDADLLPPWALAMCSAGSASLAGLLTHPVDVVKTRLQIMPAGAATARTLAYEMWCQDGPKVFMRGAGARMLMLAPGTALSWAIYEPIKRMLDY